MATTSAAAVINGLGSSFLSGGKKSGALLSQTINGGAKVGSVGAAAPRRLVVVAAVAPKQSWVPGVRGGGNFINPEWLDGSYPLVLIAMYNVWDLISRYIPLMECLKFKSQKGLLIAILSRFLFIPAFYFTAKYGDQGWMITLISFLGLTNGYLTVCVLTAAPKGYKGPEQNALGNLLVLFLLGGIFSGVALGWLWLIGNKSF